MQTNRYLRIPSHEGQLFFSPEEIIRLEADGCYTRIFFCNRKKMITSKVLKDFAAILEPMGFIRIHRSHLVNGQYVACINSAGSVIMKDESVAIVSRRMKRKAMQKLTAVA